MTGMMGPHRHRLRDTAAPQYATPSQKEGEPRLNASGQKGKGDATSLHPKMQLNEAFGTDLNRWILKARVPWGGGGRHANSR